MSNIAIRVESLGKRYRIGGKQEAYKTLRDTLTDAFVSPFRQMRRLLYGQAVGAAELDGMIWALKDISFEIKQGEVVGIIGGNGAGKSTLLKILSRITEPTEGYAEIRGRVGSLLEVGTGFHPELTGRENIYLNGAIMGMKTAEIQHKFDEIVAFAGVEKFIDTPVKHYSSGMYLRLAFSVAAHLDPEILLVDEVLAVGDAAFQKKCLGKMGEVAQEGRTVLFVSHNMPAVSVLCSKALWIEVGRIREQGNISTVVNKYLSQGEKPKYIPLRERYDRTGNGSLRFVNVEFRSNNLLNDYTNVVKPGSSVDVMLEYNSSSIQPLRDIKVAIVFNDHSFQPLFTCSMEHKEISIKTMSPYGKIVCHIESFPLLPGNYNILLWCSVCGQQADRIENAAICEVQPDDFFGSGKLPSIHKHGPFLVQHKWSICEVSED